MCPNNSKLPAATWLDKREVGSYGDGNRLFDRINKMDKMKKHPENSVDPV